MVIKAEDSLADFGLCNRSLPLPLPTITNCLCCAACGLVFLSMETAASLLPYTILLTLNICVLFAQFAVWQGVISELMMPIIAIVYEYLLCSSLVDDVYDVANANSIAIMRLSGACLQLEATRYALCKSRRALESVWQCLEPAWLSLQHN